VRQAGYQALAAAGRARSAAHLAVQHDRLEGDVGGVAGVPGAVGPAVERLRLAHRCARPTRCLRNPNPTLREVCCLSALCERALSHRVMPLLARGLVTLALHSDPGTDAVPRASDITGRTCCAEPSAGSPGNRAAGTGRPLGQRAAGRPHLGTAPPRTRRARARAAGRARRAPAPGHCTSANAPSARPCGRQSAPGAAARSWNVSGRPVRLSSQNGANSVTRVSGCRARPAAPALLFSRPSSSVGGAAPPVARARGVIGEPAGRPALTCIDARVACRSAGPSHDAASTPRPSASSCTGAA